MSLKAVLITGCSDGGIGSALGKVFHERGFHVFATARNPSRMTWIAGLENITPITLDTTKPSDIAAAVEIVKQKTGGKLDFLVNNAARNHFKPILDVSADEMRAQFEVNYVAPISVTQAFAPLIIAAKGQISFITSIAGHVNTPFMGVYSSVKRALEVVSDTLRLELAPLGVSVIAIVTGAVQSQGQTYFKDLALPASSLYKDLEEIFVSRAQGNDGAPRMPTATYAEAVVSEMQKGVSGKFWCGEMAEMVRGSATNVHVPMEAMDAGMVLGTGLDTWKP